MRALGSTARVRDPLGLDFPFDVTSDKHTLGQPTLRRPFHNSVRVDGKAAAVATAAAAATTITTGAGEDEEEDEDVSEGGLPCVRVAISSCSAQSSWKGREETLGSYHEPLFTWSTSLKGAPSLRLITVQTSPVLHPHWRQLRPSMTGARYEIELERGRASFFERHVMQCGAFITAVVTAGGICRSLIIWRTRMLI